MVKPPVAKRVTRSNSSAGPSAPQRKTTQPETIMESGELPPGLHARHPNSSDDGVHTVNQRRRRTSSSSTSASDTSSTTQPKIITAHISGLPAKFSNQKSFASAISSLSFRPVSVAVFNNGKASVRSRDPQLLQRLQPLVNIVGSPLTIDTPAPKINIRASSPPLPSFSCVARNIDLEITTDDLLSAFSKAGLNVHRTWRIQSRATNNPTTMFRILTRDKKTLDTLLLHGFTMFFRTYRCEPSRPPGPQPLQCGRCLAFGHDSTSCRKPRLCGLCAFNHPANTPCSSAPKCANCKGDHPSYAQKCPNRPTEIPAAASAPMKTVDRPAEDSSSSESEEPTLERFARAEDVIRYVSHVLINLLEPTAIPNLNTFTKEASHKFFKRSAQISITGNKYRVSIKPLAPASKT